MLRYIVLCAVCLAVPMTNNAQSEPAQPVPIPHYGPELPFPCWWYENRAGYKPKPSDSSICVTRRGDRYNRSIACFGNVPPYTLQRDGYCQYPGVWRNVGKSRRQAVRARPH